MVSGVVRIVTAIVELGLPGGWRVLDILVGLLLSVGGVVMLKNSALSGATLAVVVTMVVVALNLFGDALRDAIDPLTNPALREVA